jgi:RNA recognition motif-containing protein
MVRTKVFVGNLSFKTREAELAQEFSAHAKVISANIITRGPRSLGYGFVELESEDEARKAVAAMDKKEIDGRQINVEVAKPREEGEEENKNQQQQTGGSPNANATRGRGGARGAFRGARGTRGGNATRGAFRGGNATKPPLPPELSVLPAKRRLLPLKARLKPLR